MIHIYSQQSTERLRFIFSHIFEEKLGIKYRIYTDTEEFTGLSEKYKINYSDAPIKNSLFIEKTNLLFEENISDQSLSLSYIGDLPVCFQISNQDSVLPFDVFAACFYFLSRYEEYLPSERDNHQRFKAENSFAFKNNVLQLAIVDRWIDFLKKTLLQYFSELIFKQQTFTYIPSYDIDLAFAYRNKGFVISFSGMLKHLFRFDFKELSDRFSVFFNKRKDPYDTFDFLSALHEKYNLTPYYFFLFAKRSRFDKNTSVKNKAFIGLIKQLSTHGEIGIHASYASSFDNKKLLKQEIENLETAIGKRITTNRQHYLRIRLPESYQMFISNHIEHDFSMGYTHHIGFRAGTCFPFYFFDLKKNKATTLLIHPLLFMENVFANYPNASEEELFDLLKPCIDEIKTMKGEFVSLFHNQSFGWKEVKHERLRKLYEKIITYALYGN